MKTDVTEIRIPTIEDYRNELLPKNLFLKNSCINKNEKDPLISIVTIAWNAGKTIGKTIESIRSQTHQNIEYIIIDGGSTDNTINIINTNKDVISYFVSEPDKGISDAFNKGISVANGELIGIINADDWYPPKTLELISNEYLKQGNKIYHGDLLLHRHELGAIQRLSPAPKKLNQKMSLLHPTVFVPKKFYEEGGLFRTNLKVAMDYDLLLRFHTLKYQFSYLNKVLAEMSSGGFSDKNWKAGLDEVNRIRMHHGLNKLLSQGIYTAEKLKAKSKRLFCKTISQSFANRCIKFVRRKNIQR